MGNVHLRGEYVELESVDYLTPAMTDLILRRTEWIIRDFIGFDRSLKLALANAYLAGVNDALDLMGMSDSVVRDIRIDNCEQGITLWNNVTCTEFNKLRITNIRPRNSAYPGSSAGFHRPPAAESVPATLPAER
jgi:hypothetical protein